MNHWTFILLIWKGTTNQRKKKVTNFCLQNLNWKIQPKKVKELFSNYKIIQTSIDSL